MNSLKHIICMLLLAYTAKSQDIQNNLTINWENLLNCTFQNNVLSANNQIQPWASAVSKNTLFATEDGSIEYKFTNFIKDQSKAFGFSDSISVDTTLKKGLVLLSDMDYYFYYDSRFKNLYAVINGVWNPITIKPTQNTIIKIERVGTKVSFFVNNTRVVSTTITNTSKDWKIKCVLTNGDVLSNDKCSFNAVDISIVWTNLLGCTDNNHNLISTNRLKLATADSKNTLLPGNNGLLEYVISGLEEIKAFGFNDTLNDMPPTPSGSEKINNIDFGFYYQGNTKLWILQNGVWSLAMKGVLSGTTLKLERIGATNVVNYYVNGALVSSKYDINTAHQLIISAVLGKKTSKLCGLSCNFKPDALRAMILKEHATDDNLSSGIVSVVPKGGVYPYKIRWDKTSSTDFTKANLGVGLYSFVVTDAINDSYKISTDIGLKQHWHLQNNIMVSDDEYTQTSTNLKTAASLISYNVLPTKTDGFYEITTTETTNNTAFGFLSFNKESIDNNYNIPVPKDDAIKALLNYADSLLMFDKIKVNHSNYKSSPYDQLHIVYFNNGLVQLGMKDYKLASNTPITYQVGDIFKLVRFENTITLYKNQIAVAFENTINVGEQYLVNSLFVTKGTAKVKAVGSLAMSPNFHDLAVLPFFNCYAEPNLNWTRTRTFDETGAIKTDTKVYMDMIGRTLQTQSKVFSENNVLVTEPIYDGYGRAVGQTLPAPSFFHDICYVPNFVESSVGVAYSPLDFDKPIAQGTGSDIINNFNAWGDVNNPKAVDNSTMGKLGWYYSNNNSVDNLVPADNLPYSRAEFYPDGRVRRSAGVGSNLAMGTGHETKFIYTSTPAITEDPATNELNYVFPHRTYELEKNFSVNYIPASNINQNLQLFKTISINPDGKDQITYTNSSGQTIATCITGDGSGCVTHQDRKQLYPTTNQEKIQNLYIPKTKASTFRLTEVTTINNIETYVSTQAVPILKDINQGYVLQNGTDYSYDANSGYFTFLGNFANKSLYLQITYSLPTPIATANKLVAMVDVDYTQWTLYFYDRKGRLLANASPNDVVCQTLPYLAQRTIATGSPSQPNSSSAVTTMAFNESARTAKASMTYLKITPKANNITSFTIPASANTIAFKTAVQQQIQDSIYIVNNPYVPDSNTVVKLADTLVHLNRGLLQPNTINYYQQLDSLATKVLANAFVGKKITYTGTYVFYYQTGGKEVKIENRSMPFAFSIESDPTNPYNITTGAAFRINNLMPNNQRVALNINTAAQGIIVKIENPTIACDGFGPHGNPLTNGPLPFIPITDPLNPTNPATNPYPAGSLPLSNPLGPYIMSPNSFNPYTDLPFYGPGIIPLINSVNYAASLDIEMTVLPDVTIPIPVHLANKYMYNEYDLLVGSVNEDQGAVDYVYDQLEDKLLFTQNDKQRANGGRFSCIVYDKLGRPTITGEYKATNSGNTTPFQFQNYYDYKNGVAVASGRISTGTAAYANSSSYNDGRILEATYMEYDNADAQLPINAGNATIKQTYTAAKISKTYNTQSTTWYSYDELGRQNTSISYSTEMGYKYFAYTYNMRGNLLKSVYQFGQADQIAHSFSYDADDRLTAASYITMGNTAKPLANYSYYLHGPLKRALLGGNLQGLDYVYTIDGKLKSMNNPINPLTSADPGLDGYATGPNASVSPDAFGFTLEYYPNDYVRNNAPIKSYSYQSAFNTTAPSYAGLVRANSWRTTMPAGAPTNYSDALMYEYKYDELYRLTDAQFGTIKNSPTATFPPHTFAQLPEYKLQNMSYDQNGNIQALKRYAAPITATTAHLLDDLTYNYSPTQKNSLTRIADVASNTANYSTDLDLPNQPASANYVYNQIGELVANTQENRGFDYNAQGLTRRVYNLSTGANIALYTYNDKGLRHSKTSYNSSGTAIKVTYYSYDAGGAQVASYSKNLQITNAPVQLQDITLYGAGRVAMYDATTQTAMYELTDHLGNTRAVVTKNSSTGLAQTINFTDYFPHGSILPGRNFSSSLNFPYAYQGQERDAETGLINFELRQYDARIGRWYNPDPMGQHHSPYLAMSNNPVSSIDADGGWDGDPDGGGSLHDRYTRQNNSDAYDHSEFDNNYNHGGSLGGSINADGSFYSDGNQIYDAHQMYEKKLEDRRKKATEEAKENNTPIETSTAQFPTTNNRYSIFSGIYVSASGSDRAAVHAMYEYLRWKDAYYPPKFKYGVLVQDVDLGMHDKNARIWIAYGTSANELADVTEKAIIYTGIAAGAVITGGVVAEAYGAYTAAGTLAFGEMKFLPKLLTTASKGEQLIITRSVGAAPKGFSTILQSGGHTLKNSTLKALGLTKEQGKIAIEALKADLRLPANFHGMIMGNGDLIHPHTREVLGNLLDYLH